MKKVVSKDVFLIFLYYDMPFFELIKIINIFLSALRFFNVKNENIRVKKVIKKCLEMQNSIC